jgi:hypothetical protein
MKESWEADTCIEKREAMDPLAFSLEETSNGEHDSDDWRVPHGKTL